MAAVDRPNLFIKIPATVEGLPAITAGASAEGISVNVTLIFSPRALPRGHGRLPRRARAGPARPARPVQIDSVASFFVSRVDTEIDKRLDAIGTDEAMALQGQGRRRQRPAGLPGLRGGLRRRRAGRRSTADGAHAQRPLWASTGVKNPDYPDTIYVDELVAAGTVNTMPEKTLDAVADHGEITGDTVTGQLRRGRARCSTRLERLGIDYDDVIASLEREGVEKFVTSWDELLDRASSAPSSSKARA